MGFVFHFTVQKAKTDAQMDLPLKSTPSLVASTLSSKMMLIVLHQDSSRGNKDVLLKVYASDC